MIKILAMVIVSKMAEDIKMNKIKTFELEQASDSGPSSPIIRCRSPAFGAKDFAEIRKVLKESRELEPHLASNLQSTNSEKHKKQESTPLKGSSSSIVPLRKFDISVASKPKGVAVNQRGEVIVTEFEGHCVSVFSPDGEKISTFGAHGSGFGLFQFPRGVAVDNEGNVFIVDRDNHRIQKFSSCGRFLTAVGAKGKRNLEFNIPKDIAFNAYNGKIYIVDLSRIQVLNADLTFHCMFGKKGSDREQFDRPKGIACDSTGNVYVVDSYNHRIQVFTAEGQFLKIIGKRGQKDGELSLPAGIAIDSKDVIYVSERGNNRISMFDSSGNFKASFGGSVKESGLLKEPRGLAVNEEGILYVCNTQNDLITVFSYQ